MSEVSWVPADFHTEEKEDGRLPNRPKVSGEIWEQAQRIALANPSDIHKWDALFGIFEQQAQQIESAPEAKASLKKAVSSSFTAFLSRFPYATAYWKQFSILQYKLYGPHESIDCLDKAVRAHPQSVVLWGDYLAGLVAMEAENWKSGKEAKDSKYSVDFIRGQFLRAESLIGGNFNSDSFWDKFIGFESQISQRTPTSAPSSQLLALYLRLLRVPLYQYAQYYAQFGELSKNYGAKDVIAGAYMPEYLSRVGKSDVSDLSIIESSQLVELYAYDIFVQTQQAVTDKWQFEGSLNMQDFSISDDGVIQSQVEMWFEYLGHEISVFEAMAKKVTMPVFQIDEDDNAVTEKSFVEASNSPEIRQFLAVQSVFERALVPNCTNQELWLKYIDFISTSAENNHGKVRELYENAIFTFLPLKCEDIRKRYANYLLKEENLDSASDFWLKTIRLYSGSQRIYAKKTYLQCLKEMLMMWTEHADVQAVLESCCELYFSRVDRYKKEPVRRGGVKEKEVTKKEVMEKEVTKKEVMEKEVTKKVKTEHVTRLSQYLNDDGISVVAVQYLQNLKDSAQIRSFYNRFHTQAAFGRSVQFWRFFMDFEIAQKNLSNIKTIMEYIETSSELPKTVIDCFLDMQYEITSSNLPQVFSSPEKEPLQEILVLLNARKSDDLMVNLNARKRLAALNYVEPENRSMDRASNLMRLRSKHLAHPGIFVDHIPKITNNLMEKEWISLLDNDLRVPAMPVFRDIDKANDGIIYPEE